ncbi:RND family efflux transporter, MFP subunit [Chitinophaga sp. CF118]|uniref:efflux RND transporter periplasmic adaptor subunit n=1 Tax=Chitinophaga sp. CF118 TaxID=1884367 RepID=UPI0008E33AA7|nr:efflux RND transporter periplasmic adaptor subunit [Chitinophaga sp. CF118]SFD23817.1 RND family efflux transporter, MFP subunit [Chitinophaga sp. CF118]
MKRTYVIIIIIAALLLLVVFKLASNKKIIDEKSHPEQVVSIKIPVKVATVEEQVIMLNIIKTGNLAPFKEAKVLTTASGIVQQIRFQLGDKVKAGQVLAVIDSRSNQIDLQKAESNMSKLKNDLQTYSELFAGKAATKEKLDEIRQNYNDAVNQVTQIQRQITDASIKAPTDGIISIKSLEQGVFANAGTELATIINLSRAKVQVNLTESEVYQIEDGQSVKVTADVYPGVEFNGNVTFISPQADAAHNYTVEIMVANSSRSLLRSGTFVYADFSKKTHDNVLTIPREALTESVKDASVYVVGKDNRVSLRPVVPGREMNSAIEIRSGLRKGEQVVTSGQINLKNGTEVRVSN